MRLIYSIFIFLILFKLSFAQKQVLDGGILTGSQSWFGTIVIRGDIIVSEECILTIEPGTRVLFVPNSDAQKSGTDKTRSELIVLGTLKARGENGNKITFSSASESPRMGDWYGIALNHLKTPTVLQRCIVEYAYNGITIKNCSVQIMNSEVRYNFYAGIKSEVKATPQISQNVISENGYAGVLCELASKPVLSENVITRNRLGLVAFSLSEPNLGSLASDASNNPGKNRINNNEDYDIYNHSRKLILAQNNFWGIQDAAVISQKLYDNSDNSKYGEIKFLPLLNPGGNQASSRNIVPLAQSLENAGIVPSGNSRLVQNTATVDTSGQGTIQGPELNTDSLEQKYFAAEKIQQQMPLMAEIDLNKTSLEYMNGNSRNTAQDIDYDQIFLEPFIEGGKKRLIKKEPLHLTEVLRSSIKQGEIRIKVIVDKQGLVESANILRGLTKRLDEAILKTVYKYKYEPGRVNGQPVRYTTSEVFRFK